MDEAKINVYEVTKKLIGEIGPIGESHVDSVRFDNLKEMCDLVRLILIDIDRVAYCKNRVEHSVSKAGQYASDFYDEIGIEE